MNSTHTHTQEQPQLSAEDRIVWKDPGSRSSQINSRTSPELIAFITWVARSSNESLRFPFYLSFSLFQWVISKIDSPGCRFELPNDQIDPVAYYEKIINITQEAVHFYLNDAFDTGPRPQSPDSKVQVREDPPVYDSTERNALVEGYKSEIEFLRSQLLKKDEIIQSGQSTINTLSQLLASKQKQG